MSGLIKKKKKSAIDLSVQGTSGSFTIARLPNTSHTGARSIEVRYVTSHLTLKLDGSHNQRMLENLAPVREVFPVKTLDFEQIMQRDIDDARVASELIPYILDGSRNIGVRFFPPIIVVVLPKRGGDVMAHYPAIDVPDPKPLDDYEGFFTRTIKSGAPGAEVFELTEYLDVSGNARQDAAAELGLNTSACGLVIVDGQHRAMSLIALHRNLTRSWPDDGAPYKPFYSRWTREHIQRYDLNALQLPVVYCVFPGLHEGVEHNGEMPMAVHAACRSLFLALNKTAKTVTKARGFLLDDQDIISSMMRTTLTRIKNIDPTSQGPSGDDPLSGKSLQIYNVELDSDEDQVQLHSPMAITGITHLYHMLETLMLSRPPGTRTSVPRSKLTRNTDLEPTCLRRLGVLEQLGEESALPTRKRFSKSEEHIILDAFEARYSDLIIQLLSDFAPYEASNKASIELHTALDNNSAQNAGTVLAVLFDGQGMDRVFAKHAEALEKERSEQAATLRGVDAALLAAHKDVFARANDVEERIQEFKANRKEKLLGGVSSRLLDDPVVSRLVDDLYSRNFNTSAFQRALIVTFFDIREYLTISSCAVEGFSTSDEEELFRSYLGDLNTFFKPENNTGLARVARALDCELQFESDEVGVASVSRVDYAYTIRGILMPKELNPKEWIKFRIMLLEIWTPEHEAALERVLDLRKTLRRQVFESLRTREVNQIAKDQGVTTEKILQNGEVYTKLSARLAGLYADALVNLGHPDETAQTVLDLTDTTALDPSYFDDEHTEE